MVEPQVRIVQLEPMLVASVRAFGPSPEMIAWESLLEWAWGCEITDYRGHRFFGFNSPDPAPGNPSYGYEQWMTVGPDARADGSVVIRPFPGGRFAVMHCDGFPSPQAWQLLLDWRAQSAYRMRDGPLLEEALAPVTAADASCSFNLYLPIAG